MSERPENAFLRSLSTRTYAALAEALEPVDIRAGDELHLADVTLKWVYFPVTCLLSILTSNPDGQTVETGMAGNEGAIGVLEALGGTSITTTTISQVDGRCLRLSAALFRRVIRDDPGALTAAMRLITVQMTESRQSALCQALHAVDRRLARWLLESSDRCGGRLVLPLTQEFIAAMLGVQRTTVSVFAAELQKRGLIRYSRGRVELLDTAALEDRACDCRQVTVAAREQQELEPIRTWSPRMGLSSAATPRTDAESTSPRQS
jgi:CRP-like cAMP-binding protein